MRKTWQSGEAIYEGDLISNADTALEYSDMILKNVLHENVKKYKEVVSTYVYNDLNQLVSVVSYNKQPRTIVSNITYTYDGSGNLVSESDSVNGTIISNEYDAMNQLTRSVKTISGTIQYTQENVYNDAGQRISKSDNGDVTYFYYQGGVLLYTKDSNGNKTSQNIVGPQGNIIATIRFDNGEHAHFYNKDIRTSVTNVIDETGAGVVSYTYDDYGTTTKHGDLNFYNDICYTSGVYDELTGQYYLNARYYDPAMGTFITQDSYRGEMGENGTWNMYAYCGGNPVNYVDPSGHDAFAIAAGSEVIGFSNPIGWGILAVGAVIFIREYYFSNTKIKELPSTYILVLVQGSYNIIASQQLVEIKTYDPNPYKRAGEKKQNRENRTKARRNKDWKPKNNKRNNKPSKPKSHTPGRDHRKY